MKQIRLVRIAYLPTVAFGVLFDEELPFALTLERPWLDNQKNISCIPTGTYKAKRVSSMKFGNTFEVSDVPDRSHILFHKGNIYDDSHGCILVGEQFEGYMLQASAKGFDEFLKRTEGIDEFLFILRNLNYDKMEGKNKV